jgi:hypothetical protein
MLTRDSVAVWVIPAVYRMTRTLSWREAVSFSVRPWHTSARSRYRVNGARVLLLRR